MSKKRVLLIGLDAAEWAVINDLIAAGMMPAMKKLIENGVSGSIKTMNPPFSPMLWTSIATGKTADKHGILGFVEPTTDNKIRPISSTSRKCRALWNIFGSKNLKSNVIGWWPSHPCEPINGVMISNKFQKITGKKTDKWPLTEKTTSGLTEKERLELAALRVHPTDIGVNEVRVFVPELEKVDQDKDERLVKIRTLIAEALTIKNATQWAMNKKDWDFTAVYFNELDIFSHDFMKFHPPHRPGIPQEIYDLYKNVITATYTFYDAIVDQLVKSADENTYIVLCSDHGFHAGERRTNKIPDFAAAIALEHNPFGVVCISGPDIKKGESIYNTGLLDIAPTILSMFDLPIGKDMDGRAMNEIFTQAKQTNYIESWELEAGNFGEHDQKTKRDPFSEQEALNQLIELGYVDMPDGTAEEKIAKCLNETYYNLSIVLADKGEYQASIDILERLYEEDMVDVRYNLDLIKNYRAINNTARAREILSSFRKFDISNIVNFNYIEGNICLTENKLSEALDCFKKALIQSPRFKDLLLNLGGLYNKMRKYGDAEATFKKLIAIDPSNYQALHGLTIAYNRSGKHESAVDTALETIKLSRNYAPAYYHLGEAFYRLGTYEAAIQALELCLKMSPGISRARNLLLNIYKNHIIDKAKYDSHYNTYLQSRQGEIIVVSGLPRSGTSMMMQMLHAGGMDVLIDDSMKPDESNPKGYFEYEAVKNSKANTDWMEDASGKAVKVIAQLLPNLGMKYNIKIVFMERDIKEVVFSQGKMLSLKSTTKKKDQSFDMRLMSTFSKQLDQIKESIEEKNNIEVLYVNYKDVIENTEDEIRKINTFLNWELDENEMKNCVVKDLYRIKFN